MQGRCSGCGATGPGQVITAHVLKPCPKWVELYRKDRAAALDPVAEYTRWVESGERDAERDEARQDKVRKTDEARAAMAGRFAGGPASILEDLWPTSTCSTGTSGSSPASGGSPRR